MGSGGDTMKLHRLAHVPQQLRQKGHLSITAAITLNMNIQSSRDLHSRRPSGRQLWNVTW
eukprot:79132-Chlamydomonas_euryale.AAC.1